MVRLRENKSLSKSVIAISILALFLQGCATPESFSPGYRQMAEKNKQVNLEAERYCAPYINILELKAVEDGKRIKGSFSSKKRFQIQTSLQKKFASLAKRCLSSYKKTWVKKQSISARDSRSCLLVAGILTVFIVTAPVGAPMLIYCSFVNHGAPHIYDIEIDSIYDFDKSYH